MKEKISWLIIMVVLCLLLSACGEVAIDQAPEIKPEKGEAAPTKSLLTNTPKSTESPTPTPTSTPMPPGLLFYDGFNGELEEGWIWQNEVPEKWRLSDDGWLEITAEDGGMLGDIGTIQTNLLLREMPNVSRFEISSRLIADTTSDFQQAAIFFIEDPDNFLVINRGHCSICPTKGEGIFTDYEYDGKIGSLKAIMTDADEIYFRIVYDREAGFLTAFYAIEPEKWIQLRKIPIDLNYQMIGLGATNGDSQNKDDDLIAKYDYFEVWDLDQKK